MAVDHRPLTPAADGAEPVPIAPGRPLTARRAGLVGCRHCGRTYPIGTGRCDRCGAALASRFPQSRQRVWAWWLAGLVAYVPANLYPMMITNTLTGHHSSTIVGGAIDLITSGDVFVGIVVLVASVLIPVGKFAAIATLMMQIERCGKADSHRLHKIYEVVEFIGRWSMIDVFVVAILSALVHLGSVVSITPGFAAACFGASVVFTMLSANSLDPRLIWDAIGDTRRERSAAQRA